MCGGLGIFLGGVRGLSRDYRITKTRENDQLPFLFFALAMVDLVEWTAVALFAFVYVRMLLLAYDTIDAHLIAPAARPRFAHMEDAANAPLRTGDL